MCGDFGAQRLQLGGQLVVGCTDIRGFSVLAHLLNTHDQFNQAVDAKHRRESFQLVQHAVHTMHVVMFQQCLNARQVFAQSLVQGVQQG